MRDLTFRQRLAIALVGICIGTGSVILGLNYLLAKDALRRQIDSTALSIAVTAASFLDGDRHQQITAKTATDSELWQSFESTLKSIRSVNQRQDVYVKYIFTLIPSATDNTQMAFAVDTIDPGVEYGKPGELYELKPGALPIDDDACARPFS